MKKILSKVRKCIDDFSMIEDGDVIAVGISGGKDSLTLLRALVKLREFYPMSFEVFAATVDMGFEGADYSPIRDYCHELNIKLVIQQSDIAEVLFSIRKEKNPCSLCANMRRGILNTAAKANGANKVALGHHMNDAIETFFLSLFNEGRVNCFKPVTYLSRVDLQVIRPLLYVEEHEIIQGTLGLPVMNNPCPANGVTKREDMKNFVRDKSVGDKYFPTRIFGAIKRDVWDS